MRRVSRGGEGEGLESQRKYSFGGGKMLGVVPPENTGGRSVMLAVLLECKFSSPSKSREMWCVYGCS